ncbi:cupin domain-containing protein [Microvirga yunnanensis]|uniref:cupin domain-containing protein n=1 Tax=Microvirga yunnanensis TaxID=2953740 RepID=UPI0021CA1C62|nr:cupin domain-containing protein [Microvirga sp. HBU65207]
MRIIDHTGQAQERWPPGVVTRMCISAETGAEHLCVFEQWCDPGCGAPAHLHTVEEVLTVLAGHAEIWTGDERATVPTGQSVIVPVGHQHGFRNTGETVLHIRAILAASMFGPVTTRDETAGAIPKLSAILGVYSSPS